VEVVASLSQGRTAAAQCGLFTHKSVPVIFEPPCTISRFMFHEFFPENCAVYGIMCRNMVESGRPQVTTYGACAWHAG